MQELKVIAGDGELVSGMWHVAYIKHVRYTNSDYRMDENVNRIKALLEEGYKIAKYVMEFGYVSGEQAMMDKVSLVKEGDTQIIESTNSKEFFEYMQHFKKVKDQYDNPGFIYIDNLDQYNKQVHSKDNPPVLKDHHKLKISGRLFSEGIMTMQFIPSGPKSSKGLAEFWISLEKNPEFINVDFKDELEVYDRSDKIVFRGYVKNYESSDKTGFISAQDMSLKMEHERVSAEFVKMEPIDCVGLLTEGLGFGFKPHGIPYNTTEREFVIIAPIQNLLIDRSFNIGDVEFYQVFDTIDDGFIRKSDTGRTNDVWNGNFPRAKVRVQAKQYFEAIVKGYNKISSAVDLISLRVDFSFPSLKIDAVQTPFTYSYYKNFAKVKIPTMIYCREKDKQACVFYDLQTLKESVLSLEIDPSLFFRELSSLCGDIISNNTPTREEQNLLQSIHWLRRAIQEGNKKDKLVDLWTSLEFIVSGVKMNELFSDAEIKRQQSIIMKRKSLDDDQKKAICSKLNMLNDSPLMEKIFHMVKELSIKLSKEEIDVLRRTRNKRNDLIHGRRDIEVDDGELSKTRTIIEKLFIAKVNNIKPRH